ncbi:MAG: hypothetical protein ABIQ32_13790 [Sphingomicrobium sp.]
MAVEPATHGTHSGDHEAHVRDYSRFIGMFKWGAVVCFVIAMVVLVVISK